MQNIKTHRGLEFFYGTYTPCQDSAGNLTTQRLPKHQKERQTEGTVKGGEGRQKKRLEEEDNNRVLTGLEFAKSQKAVENREKWRKLVVKALFCGAPTTVTVKEGIGEGEDTTKANHHAMAISMQNRPNFLPVHFLNCHCTCFFAAFF